MTGHSVTKYAMAAYYVPSPFGQMLRSQLSVFTGDYRYLAFISVGAVWASLISIPSHPDSPPPAPSPPNRFSPVTLYDPLAPSHSVELLLIFFSL